MVLVKACGLKSLEEICWAQKLGYDFIGIMLDPKSKRYVAEPEQLWQGIAPKWRSRCVLVARNWQSLATGAKNFPEALLQCYDGYPSFILPVRRFQPISSEAEYWSKTAAFHLYDVSLGSGEWQGIPPWCQGKDGLFVAGGLNLENLQALKLHNVKASFGGFDLSSGLEEEGRKNFAKMQACIEWIRSHF